MAKHSRDSRDKDEIIKDLQAQLEDIKAAKVVSSVEVERQALRATAGENSRIRADLKARTKKTGTGRNVLAHYYITSPFYRRGVYVNGNNVVQLPIDEDPSITWKAVGPTGLVLEDDTDNPMERQPGADDLVPEPNTMSEFAARRPSDIPLGANAADDSPAEPSIMSDVAARRPSDTRLP